VAGVLGLRAMDRLDQFRARDLATVAAMQRIDQPLA
jgi:hypothetical protein